MISIMWSIDWCWFDALMDGGVDADDGCCLVDTEAEDDLVVYRFVWHEFEERSQ